MKKIAFVFPGQGSQAVGMGKWLISEYPLAKQTFQEASDTLKLDIEKLCFEGPESELQLTANTQPALLTLSTATARVLNQNMGLNADLTAGHSIGEYASFVLAGVIPFSTALRAVRLRGEAMQSAVPAGQGGMVALMGATEEQALKICSWVQDSGPSVPNKVQPANFNSPGQIVLSGPLSSLNWMRENFKSEAVLGESLRIKMIPLNVSAPFHCDMMKPAEIKMADFFESIQFSNAQIPIFQNLSAQEEMNAQKLKSNLIQQVSGSVRWLQSVQNMVKEYDPIFIECGHGSVLKGLIKKTSENSATLGTQSLEDFQYIQREFKPRT